MTHGIGVANAYLVGECGSSSNALLFDTGSCLAMLETDWPAQVRGLSAVFLTHVEAEHAGGLCDVVARFGVSSAFIPRGAVARCGRAMGEGETANFGKLEVTAYSTPGHAAAHNCYLVRSTGCCKGAALLISGDLVFAGSVGNAFFSVEQLQANLRRMLTIAPPSTVIAPGHGPLTTVQNELRFNPFVV
jgi:glyoxylase-like metal-dependent hydrolase (beta-lactamase superfamily II)